MTVCQHDLPMPPLPTTADGRLRRVGVEMELAGLSVDEAVAVLAAQIGGRPSGDGRYEVRVDGDPAGPWQVEIDSSQLKALGRRPRDDSALGGAVGLAEDTLRFFAEQVEPIEVISPPLPLDRLGDVNRLIARLREAGALGTGDDPAYAFGLQLNPELPDTGAGAILAYLRAFLCLEDWLRQRAHVDVTRRLTAFTDPFPRAYARRVVDAGYAPDLARLMDDYLDANPTRNRALDLLPLCLHLDPARVRSRVRAERVKPRPALHYRLPNSDIGRPDWDLGEPWADWLAVEALAADPARLAALCAACAAFLDRPLGRFIGDWERECDQWLAAQPRRSSR